MTLLPVEQVDRRYLADHEQMADAQSQCVPCSLCGGKAVISDAGRGAGYYIRCENGSTFSPKDRCLITDRRLSGWAYNVMEWWNRLHLSTESTARLAGVKIGLDDWQDIATAPTDGTRVLIAGGTFRDDDSIGGPYAMRAVTIAHWTGDDYGEDHPWEGQPCHSHDDYRRHAPTHWMPLSPPPSPETLASKDSGHAE